MLEGLATWKGARQHSPLKVPRPSGVLHGDLDRTPVLNSWIKHEAEVAESTTVSILYKWHTQCAPASQTPHRHLKSRRQPRKVLIVCWQAATIENAKRTCITAPPLVVDRHYHRCCDRLVAFVMFRVAAISGQCYLKDVDMHLICMPTVLDSLTDTILLPHATPVLCSGDGMSSVVAC
jgi:hypothetical protein